MEIVGPIWDAAKCLWSCSTKHTAYICDLKDNLNSLKRQQSELQNVYGDVKRRIEQAENARYMRRTDQVAAWLQQVNTIEEDIKPILEQGDGEIQNKCLGTYCPKNYVSTYYFGKKVDNMLKRTQKQLDKGKEFTNVDVAYKLPRTAADELPVGKNVGMDTMLKKVCNSIQDKNVNMIGLYGMGGVGKTTLLKRINNELANTLHDFSLVIWVVVSKDYSIENIRDVIRKKLEIGDDIWNNRSDEEKVTEIYKALKQKKFIMLLDDIWEHLNLQELLGVPLFKETNSKVLFTTWFEKVCHEMKAQKIFEIKCFTNKLETFELFCLNAGEEAHNPKFRKQAENIVSECEGLPLALVTVGRAMAGLKSIEAWNHAVNQVESYPSKFSDMEKKVLSVLKVSYDKLVDDTHRKCFLYCALFPEDYEIDVEKLIDLWVGEGFLNDGGSRKIYHMYDYGKFVIENLKSACVLESVDDLSSFSKVKMHDVVREMALWIFCDEDQNKNKVLVQTEASTPHVNLENLKFIERIVITDSRQSDWMVPACPNLQTVILIGDLGKIDFSNSQCLSRLKVLDLSQYRIVPGVAVELTAEIGQLIHLEFLSLSRLNLKGSLAIELKNLKSLKTLLMEDLDSSFEILPYLEVISSLEGLKVFRFTRRYTGSRGSGINEEKTLLEKLESLANLEELCIKLQSATAMDKLIGLTKLQRCLRKLKLVNFTIPMDWDLFWAFMSTIEHLEFIHLEDITSITNEDPSISNIDCFSKLRRVEIRRCNSIIHLTWLKYAPLLEFLKVSNCGSIQQVINEPEAPQDTFSRLLFLELEELPNLTTIHERDLSFPSLKSITIEDCPNLKKLPFGSNFATHNNLREVNIDNINWWARLEWEDPTLKETLDSKASRNTLRRFYWQALYRISNIRERHLAMPSQLEIDASKKV